MYAFIGLKSLKLIHKESVSNQHEELICVFALVGESCVEQSDRDASPCLVTITTAVNHTSNCDTDHWRPVKVLVKLRNLCKSLLKASKNLILGAFEVTIKKSV